MALIAETGYAALNVSTMPVYLKNDRGFGAAFIGFVLVAFLLSEAMFKSPMGALADRIGRKKLIVFGPSLTVGTSLLTLIVPHGLGLFETGSLLLLRALDGLGAAMLWPAAFALMSDSVSDAEREQSMSLLNACYLTGVAIALPLGGMANDLLGPHLPHLLNRAPGLFLSALLFASVAITAQLTVPADGPHPHHPRHPPGEADIRGFLKSMRDIPEYLLLAAVTFMGIGFPMAIVKLFAEEQFLMSESKFGALVFPGVIAMAVLSVPMSRLSERIGRSRAVHVGMFLCMAGMAAIGLGMFFPVLRQPWVVALGGIPVGIGFLMAIPAWMASVSDIDHRARGANLGAVMTAQGLGAIVGALIGGAVYDSLQGVGVTLGLGEGFGRYSPFMGCALCIAAGWILSLRILRPSPRQG
jgi:DHA1 family multidrug resistance protein-like MFS transporter